PPLGFRKRVLYLDESLLDAGLVGAAVDHPGLRDAVLRRRVHQLHGTLADPGDELEAQSRLALIVDRLRGHLGGGPDERPAGPTVARRLRELLDERGTDGLGLTEAAGLLHGPATH